MDKSYLCQSFPSLCGVNVSRDNVIGLIEDCFNDNKIVFIEGGEGIGKTTLLAQFVSKHSDSSVAYFLRSSCSFSSDTDIIGRELYSQIRYLTDKTIELDSDGNDYLKINHAMYKLHVQANRERKNIYVVLDGFCEGIDGLSSLLRGLIEKLPIGYERFRFLFSCTSLKKLGPVFDKENVKSLPLTTFSEMEVFDYFDDTDLSKTDVAEISSITKKPGLLAGIKSVVESGGSLNCEGLVSGGDEQIFEAVWRQVDDMSSCLVRSIAIVCFNRGKITIERVSKILNEDVDKVYQCVDDTSFLDVTDNSNIEFKSQNFREFAKKKLAEIEGEVVDLIIDDLTGSQLDSASMVTLPVLLKERGDLERLFSFLSTEHFHQFVDSCQSLYPLQNAADVGVEVAYSQKSDEDLMRLGLQRSIMTDLDQGELVRSEVEANLAFGDEDTAITIAHSCSTREERLHALALIVRAKQEEGLGVAAEIVEEVRQLSVEIDPSCLGEKAFEIAELLSLSYPELAINLLERASGDDDGELDMSLIKLSFSTLGFSGQKESGEEAFNTVRAKIKNPKLKKVISSLTLLFEEYESSRVLQEVDRFDGVNERLIFLKEWLKSGRNKEGAGEVIDRALNLIIGATEYSPTAKDYREIATPLACLSCENERRMLASKILEQKRVIESVGPTEEVVRLELILAHSEYVNDVESAIDKYVELYLKICSIEDLIVKMSCLSYFVINIKNVDKGYVLEERESIHSLSGDEYDENLDLLLSTTAQHYDAVERMIKPLSRHCYQKAVFIADRLNVLSSRDQTYCDIVKYGTDKNSDGIPYNVVFDLVSKIKDYEIRDDALTCFVENFAIKKGVDESTVESCSALFYLVPKIKDLERRCRISCLSINFLNEYSSEKIKSIIDKLIQTIEDTFDSIDVKWVKISVGLKLVKYLSAYSIGVARDYYKKVEGIRADCLIDSYPYALNYVSCVYMSIRSFAGLLPKKCNTVSDLDRIVQLIDDVPSFTDRAKLYAVLSLNCHANKEYEMFEEIVSNNVIENLDNISECRMKDELVCIVCPALYLYHRSISFTYINKLPLPQRDDAIFNIIDYLCKKTPPNDPFESFRGYKYKLKWLEILDICELLTEMDSDSAIYYVIERISVSVRGKSTTVLSRQQRADLVQRLNVIVDELFPRANHIKHEGFALVSKASILSIKQKCNKSEWEPLIKQARDIPNLADKIYVLGIIAATMSGRDRKNFDGLIDEAVSLIIEMPSPVDKINRYESLADMLKDVDSAISHKCLKFAMQVASGDDSPNITKARKKLVDLAYRLDPDLASSLTAMIDDDPARSRSKDDLEKHYRFLENKANMKESLSSVQNMSDEFIDELPVTCWRSLGSINAGRFSSLHIDNIRKIIEVASRKPMSEAFPMLSFGIQNINKRYQNTDQVHTFIRPLFDAVLVSADLAKVMAKRTSGFIDIAKNDSDQHYEDTMLIKPGDRDRAIDYILKIIESSNSSYVKICDNFFSLTDLEWLKIIATVKPKARFYVLTSRKQQTKDGISGNYEEAFSRHWRVSISDQSPPDSDVIVVGTASKGDLPLHDRWIILEDCGIRIGTSLKSIGVSKGAELSVLSEQARSEFESEVDKFIDRDIRLWDGEKVSISTFSL